MHNTVGAQKGVVVSFGYVVSCDQMDLIGLCKIAKC